MRCEITSIDRKNLTMKYNIFFDFYQRSRSVSSLKKATLLLAIFCANTTILPKEMLIRDVSWSGYTYFVPNSYYTLLDPIYADKITLLEEEVSGSNFMFNWLDGIIPRTWNINTGKTTVWNYDPLDALYVGIQGANSKITEACIDLLPISKALILSGKTLDIRTQKVKVDGKVDLSQFISLNAMYMDAKLSKSRLNKTISVATAGIALAGAAKAEFVAKLLSEHLGINTEALEAFLSNHHVPKGALEAAYLLPVVPLVSALVTQRVENACLEEYVKNFEIIMGSDKVIFNKKQALEDLSKLVKKIKQFGFGRQYAKRLQTIIEKI